MSIIEYERFQDLADENGFPSQRLAEFLEEITRQVNQNTVLIGTGSPEGVLAANIKTLYMDKDGTAGNILYVKKAGSSNTGWILV